jgi:hypothetical protein
MPTTGDLQKALANLVREGTSLVIAFRKPDGKNDAPFNFDYQKWYTKALPVVRTLATDRYEEFRRYYEADPKRKGLGYGSYVIHDFVKGVAPNKYSHPNFDTKAQVVNAFLNQIAILSSVVDRLDSVLADIEGRLFADLKDAELATASALLKISPRAAGALAGVVLEAHLQRVATSRGVKIAKKAPTIADLNDPLKQEGVYETATWRKVGYLADLRNLCCHKKGTDPTAEQVVELLEGVNWAIKTVS